MNSKLIEALNKCETQKSYENVRYTLIDDELRAYIEESLERLEALEKEKKDYFEIICKQAYLLNNKHIDKPIIEMYIQENEKLKKKLDIYQKYTGVYYDEDTKKYYIAVDCDFGCKGDVMTKEEFEVLGE